MCLSGMVLVDAADTHCLQTQRSVIDLARLEWGPLNVAADWGAYL